MPKFVACLIAMACLASPAWAVVLPPPPQPIDGSPMTWRTKPDYMRFSALINDFGTPEGSAVVECVVNKRGQPDDCTVISEEPSKSRLGALVQKIASHYRASKTDKAGLPTTGRRVRYSLTIGRGVVP